MEIKVFSRGDGEEHKLLIHHLADAYENVANKVTTGVATIASRDLNENVDAAKHLAVESFEKVKDTVTTVATKENLEVVKNKTIEGAVVAKDAVVTAGTAVYTTVTNIDVNKTYEDTKNAVTDMWNSLW
jgi:tRNA(Ile2) C34 agmatinyltransferase TiaS